MAHIQRIARLENGSIRRSNTMAKAIMKKWSGEGGCKYCKTPPEYLAICQNYETRIFVGISGEYLQIFDEDYPGFCDNHKINFCPICGRKLS